MTVADTIVIWNTRYLGKEFNLSPQKVARILKKLGATRFSRGGNGSKWIWE
ncbi:unnamed protein product [marine sediment metagenome]|uniref:Uncharacterized protein n=1 Tax=marine sediment metagenome TaxID=412755 RepID=X1JS46_9ZZZZ